MENIKFSVRHKELGFIALMLGIVVTGVFTLGYFMGNNYRLVTQALDVGQNSVHVTVFLQRVGEDNEFWDHHAGVLTTIGKNFIEGKLGDDTPYASNGEFADDISLSVNTGTPVVGWTIIPGEISTGGLDRNLGTYTSTGDGVYEIEYQFTATATHTDVQLTGLNWLVTDSSDNNLLCADTFTPVTLNSGDKLTVTWEITIS